MKCNIAQDLMPLYAEGLCSEETAKELEEHFAECEKCAALKSGFAMPLYAGGLCNEETALEPEGQIAEYGKRAALKSGVAVPGSADAAGGENFDKEIKPFKKIRRRLKINVFVIIALGLVTAVILFFLGGLLYGELNPQSNGISFSRIARNIEIRKIAGLLENGDIDGFAAHIHGSDTWHMESATNSLMESFKSAYREELGGKSCKVTRIDTSTVNYGDGTYDLLNDVTFDFEGEQICMTFRKVGNYYKVYVINGGEELKSVQHLGVLSAIDYIMEYTNLMRGAPRNFLSFFSGNGFGEIAELYRIFEEDGSDIVYAYASMPVFNEDKDILQCQCCFKFRDNNDNMAVFEFTANFKNYLFYSADMSTINVINEGMSDEKIEQVIAILAASA